MRPVRTPESQPIPSGARERQPGEERRPADDHEGAAVSAIDSVVRTTGPVDGLRVEQLATAKDNRWSADGEPTLYLASSDAVVLAEFGRHLDHDDSPVGVWSIRVRATRVVDLRSLRTSDPIRLLDRDWCREIARRWRSDPECEGMLVPSVAFLDRPDAWNVVLFVERLRRPLHETLGDARRCGVWRLADDPSRAHAGPV